MGKNSKDSNLMWQIRNNVRKNNFKAVADTVKNVIYMDEENPEKEQLMKKIYIDVIEPWVRGANIEQEVPRQYEEMFIDFAKKLDESSEQEKILNMLKRIENSKNSKTQKKVRRQISLMGLTQELLKDGDIDAETVEKYADELEKNTDNSTYAELISKLFGKEFPIEILNVEQLEKTLGGEGHKHREENGTIKELKKYPDEIKVDKRLKFLIEELDVEPTGRFAETGIFSGSILLDVKDSDMVIVERLFEIYADGTYDLANQQSGKASSTYILPKDKILKMVEAEAKSKVRKELEKETEDEGLGKWKPIRHTVSWMNRVKDRVDHAKEIQQEEITNLEDGISEESKIDSNLEEKEELGDTLYETSPSKEETLQLDGKNAEELSTEQLEEQLKMLKEQNKKKAQLYRKQLLEQIKQEQQKGLQLDKQIEEAKHTIDIGE
jgi:hypothetical protein